MVTWPNKWRQTKQWNILLLLRFYDYGRWWVGPKKILLFSKYLLVWQSILHALYSKSSIRTFDGKAGEEGRGVISKGRLSEYITQLRHIKNQYRPSLKTKVNQNISSLYLSIFLAYLIKLLANFNKLSENITSKCRTCLKYPNTFHTSSYYPKILDNNILKSVIFGGGGRNIEQDLEVRLTTSKV